MRVAMLLHKDVTHDSRVLREADALREQGHEVTVVDLPAPPRRLPLSLHRFGIFWSLLRRCLALRPDVVHAHDAAMLAPGWIASRLGRCALVYDSHELATGVPYRSRLWALYVRVVERLLIGSADAVVTVSGGIADRLLKRGLRVTISSDGRTTSATTVSEEFERLRGQFGWGAAEFAACQRHAAEAAFAPPRVRDALLARLSAA